MMSEHLVFFKVSSGPGFFLRGIEKSAGKMILWDEKKISNLFAFFI